MFILLCPSLPVSGLVKAINTAVDLIVAHFGTSRDAGVKVVVISSNSSSSKSKSQCVAICLSVFSLKIWKGFGPLHHLNILPSSNIYLRCLHLHFF